MVDDRITQIDLLKKAALIEVKGFSIPAFQDARKQLIHGFEQAEVEANEGTEVPFSFEEMLETDKICTSFDSLSLTEYDSLVGLPIEILVWIRSLDIARETYRRC